MSRPRKGHKEPVKSAVRGYALGRSLEKMTRQKTEAAKHDKSFRLATPESFYGKVCAGRMLRKPNGSDRT